MKSTILIYLVLSALWLVGNARAADPQAYQVDLA
jgi:hypothetical protein